MEDWKIAIAEGVRKTERTGTGRYRKAVRVYTYDRATGEEIHRLIKQNISQIPPYHYESISGDAVNRRDFTVHFATSGDAWDFCTAIDGYALELGDYDNGRSETKTETVTGDGGAAKSNAVITIAALVLVGALGYWLWKRAK